MRGVVAVPWSDEERAELRRLFENGLSRMQIARLMGRTDNSINRQMTNMGLVRHHDPMRVKGAPLQRPRTTLAPLPSLSDLNPEDWWP